jgi:hypothetical protein
MKKLVFGLFFASSLLFPMSARADESGTVQGKQYIVLGGGPRPIADNPIGYMPCNTDGECGNLESKLKETLEETPGDSAKLHKIVAALENLVDTGKKAGIARTDYDGNYSFKCPTSECLMFGYGQAGRATAIWYKVAKSNSKVDLTVSNAIFIMNK